MSEVYKTYDSRSHPSGRILYNMSMIWDGKAVVPAELENARGGTELMRDRLVSWMNAEDPSALLDVDIHVGRVYPKRIGKKTILWVHDLPRDLPSNMFDQYDAIVFVSQWQRDMFDVTTGGNLLDKSHVIPNTFEFGTNTTKHENDLFEVVYHTTPHRGLDVAVNAFNEFHKQHPDSRLNIFSSFEVYGRKEDDAKFSSLFDLIEKSDGVVRHQVLPNDQLVEVLPNMDCFLYPSTWHETSCLAMMEALSAGLICVYPRVGALCETTGSFGVLFDPRNNKQHLTRRALSGLEVAYDLIHKHGRGAWHASEQAYLFHVRNGGPDLFLRLWHNVLNEIREK